MSAWLKDIRGFLFDLDGVMYVGGRPIEGAADAIRFLKGRGFPCRYTTNTTVLSNQSLHQKLVSLGLPIEREEVFGVIRAAVALLRREGSPPCYYAVSDDPATDFAEFPQTAANPRFVVIGDLAKGWDYREMQKVFEMLMDGAEMIALHKGRYWQTEEGIRMDLGAFVAGLEYVTSKTATVVGKPSRDFFQLALDDLGLPPEKVVMIGDDLINDIGGAQALGVRGVLVRTGKFRQDALDRSEVEPDLVIDSIASLPNLL